MPIPLLAAIPAIINVASKVSKIFSKAKEIKEQVTGTPSQASSPEELQEEIANLPQEQQIQWAEKMKVEVEMYAKQNERLDIEIGRIDSNITSKLTSEDAGKIAVLRQTTRPWAVRMMVHYIFFPFYLVIIDIVQMLLKNWIFFWADRIKPFETFKYLFGELNLKTMSDSKVVEVIKELASGGGNIEGLSFGGQLYMSSIPWVTGIIVSYMGLREIGKARGTSGDQADKTVESSISDQKPFGQAITKGLDLVGKVRELFKKRKD
ncbi:MAG: hypothetical protein K9G76_06655 [Bacteroidales bacterium]|nr:hypothetical protein [Bacteroidales bacterium]MCF8402290.1 hypothetical protein [Bacteroidales bacterium]